MGYWSDVINSSREEIANIDKKVEGLNIEKSARDEIVRLVKLATNAEQLHANTLKESDKLISGMLDRTTQFFSRMATMALRNMWRDAISYVSEYND